MTQALSEKKHNALWNFFSSVRLTIVLLILLAVASVVGTLIPQAQDAAPLAQSLSPRTLRLFEVLNLFDIYHALWFRLLIGLLTLNLVICSINRFPSAWKRFKSQPGPERSRIFENLPEDQTLSVSLPAPDASGRVEKILKRRFKHIRSRQKDGKAHFVAEKGRFAHFGVYVVHLSILIILIGSLVGSFAGMEGYVNIAEGDEVRSITLRNNMSPYELGFAVRCDKFLVEFHENGAPKEFRSDLRFFVDNQEVMKASARVNHPVRFRGLTFYQSSYGTVPGGRLKIRVQGPANTPAVFEVQPHKEVPLPGNEGSFRVEDVRKIGTMPAALIVITPKQGDEVRFWIFQDFEEIKKRFPQEMLDSPKFNAALFAPYTFVLDGQENRYYTGLQVSRDPGVPIVWLGCFMMVGGFFLTFFHSHRRIWVRVLPGDHQTAIQVAGSASKNPVGLAREVEKVLEDLRGEFE